MKIRMIEDQLLVKPEKADKKYGKLIIPATAHEDQATGTVLEAGPGRTALNTGVVIPMPVEKGDKVLFNKRAGNDVNIDEEDLLIFSAMDVYCVIEEPETEEPTEGIVDATE